jgi:MFS family permease
VNAPATTRSGLRRRRALVLGTAGLGGLLYGIDLGIIASALPYLEATLHLTPAQLSLVVAAVLLGCVFATLGAGVVCDRMGRRPALIAAGVVFVASIPLIACAGGFASLMAGRLLKGASAGLIGVAVPLYLAESLGAANRGSGVGLFQWLLTVGILVAALIGMAFSLEVDAVVKSGDTATVLAVKDRAWRSIFWTALPPGVLFLVGAMLLGESPRWLHRRGRIDEARAALLRLRDPATAEAELAAMGQPVPDAGHATAPRDTLWQRRYLHPFALACLVLACNQLTGVNSLIGYNTTILLQGGLDDVQAHWGYVVFNTIGCAATVIAVLLVDRLGRTVLLSIGTAGIVVTLATIGFVFRASESEAIDCREHLSTLITAEQAVVVRFDQALSDRLVAGQAGGGRPTTLVVISSYGGFRSASVPRRSDDPHAKEVTITHERALPATALGAFLANPFADLDAARRAPLVIERAVITPVPTSANGWLVACCLWAFKAFFAIGPGVCVWLALSELMPTRIRSNGMSIALLGNHVVSTTIAALFLPTVGSHGYGAVFLLFAGCTTVYFIIARFFLPETKGRTLEEIERSFARRAAA